MPAITHLSDIWEHTITKILIHDPKSEVGNHDQRMGDTEQNERFQFIIELWY